MFNRKLKCTAHTSTPSRHRLAFRFFLFFFLNLFFHGFFCAIKAKIAFSHYALVLNISKTDWYRQDTELGRLANTKSYKMDYDDVLPHHMLIKYIISDLKPTGDALAGDLLYRRHSIECHTIIYEAQSDQLKRLWIFGVFVWFARGLSMSFWGDQVWVCIREKGRERECERENSRTISKKENCKTLVTKVRPISTARNIAIIFKAPLYTAGLDLHWCHRRCCLSLWIHCDCMCVSVCVNDSCNGHSRDCIINKSVFSRIRLSMLWRAYACITKSPSSTRAL